MQNDGNESNAIAKRILYLDDILGKLHLTNIPLKINNSNILRGLSEKWGFDEKWDVVIPILKKWGEWGENATIQELGSKGFSETQIHQIQHLFRLVGPSGEKLNTLDTWFSNNEKGQKGISKLRQIYKQLEMTPPKNIVVEIDFKLLHFGVDNISTIFEVELKKEQIMNLDPGIYKEEWNIILSKNQSNNPAIILSEEDIGKLLQIRVKID